MTFKEATDRLLAAGVDLREIADALGVGHQYVRAMRAERGAKVWRAPPPPEKWRPALAALARARIEALESFVRDAGVV